MTRLQQLIFGMLLLLCTHAMAGDPSPPSESMHRQIAHCMLKRMSANKNESYHFAFKTCRDDLRAPPTDVTDTAMNIEGNNGPAKH